MIITQIRFLVLTLFPFSSFMKKLFAALFILLATTVAQADQLEWITKAQAEQAVKYLESQSELILWCACCTDDVASKIALTKVYYEKVAEADGYYQVFVEGTDEFGNEVSRGIDLAYVHVKVGRNAQCLGRVLRMKCDPCTRPFPWVFQR